MRIDLFILAAPEDGQAIDWPEGETHYVAPTTQHVAAKLAESIDGREADAVLVWDGMFGMPSRRMIQELLRQPGDVWHAGLQLGMGGQPGLIDFVAPTWMLNRDPAPDVAATSWRISLRACLIRTEVLRQMGGPDPRFRTLEGAALEMGHRFIARGVMPRSHPTLLADGGVQTSVNLPFEDELRFIDYRFGRAWCRWAFTRAVLSGYVSPLTAYRAARRVFPESPPVQPTPYARPASGETAETCEPRVSVLIPTLDRYPFLRTVLRQLGEQTVRPLEVIVIDQTAAGERQTDITAEFPDLPLVICHQDQPGQCSSRNRGLQMVRGDLVLFLDDDDEIEPDLIERHLHHLGRMRVPVSCGVAHEVGAGPLPGNFTYARVSDVFPTNNTMIQKCVLKASGLFDLAYDRGQRADADLGMRVYLSGARMALNPDIAVLHHHAPRGGLRAHKARVITYASSRQRLTHRHLPSVSEIYLARRYFTPRQVRESLWQRAVGTLSGRGRRWKRALKCVIGLALMPSTLWQIRRRCRIANEMFDQYPSIPNLAEYKIDSLECEAVQ